MTRIFGGHCTHFLCKLFPLRILDHQIQDGLVVQNLFFPNVIPVPIRLELTGLTPNGVGDASLLGSTEYLHKLRQLVTWTTTPHE